MLVIKVEYEMASTRIRAPFLSTSGAKPGSAGTAAATRWLADRGLSAPSLKRWHVEVSLANGDTQAPLQFDDRVDTRFHVDVYSEEWGFFFCHGGRASWIRVTDIAFVHGRDDFGLLPVTPRLADIGVLLRAIEKQHALAFRRHLALVRTNMPGSEPKIRRWVESL